MRTLHSSPSLALALVLAAAAAALGARAFAAGTRGDGDRGEPPELRPDLNSAPERHLRLLPGIGPSRARAILEDRARNGRFGSAVDLARVRGIGPGTVASLAPLIRVSEGATGGDP